MSVKKKKKNNKKKKKVFLGNFVNLINKGVFNDEKIALLKKK